MRNKIAILIILIIVIAIGVLAYVFFGSEKSIKIEESSKPKIIQENLVVPNTRNITESASKSVNESAAGIILSPKNEGETFIVPNAILTLKGGYNLALPQTLEWASDAKPVFIKSLGVITLDGKSSQWQIAFNSKTEKKGYEIIIQGDKIVSEKEIESSATGAEAPVNWPDAANMIKTLQARPAFSDATVSSFLLTSTPESKDVKWWLSIGTSKGTVTFEVK